MSLKKLFSKPIISLVMVWVLVFLGVMLRSFKADSFPVDNNDDGLFYVWAGSTFLDNPLSPISHSIFDQNNSALLWRSQFRDYIPIERFGLKIVQPWFDHPPLATVLVALPAKLLGYTDIEVIPQFIVRYPALIASIFTLWLTYLLAEKLFKKKVALLSLLFLATIPYFVIAHRQSFLENFLTPLFLGCLLYLLKFLQTKKNLDLIILMILSFIIGWFKIPGFTVPFMIMVWLLYKKENKAGSYLFGIGLASIGSYLAYGLIANKELFLTTITNQQIRGAFPSSFFMALTRPEFYGEFKDGWYVMGYLFSFLLFLKSKKDNFKFFGWFFATWSIVLFILSGPMSNSPWYRYPLIPFLAIAIGYFADQLLKKNSLFLVLPFFLLGLTGLDLLNITVPATWLRLGTTMFFSIYGLYFIWQKPVVKKICFWTTRLFLITLVILNIYVCLRFTTIHCSQERCLAPKKIILTRD